MEQRYRSLTAVEVASGILLLLLAPQSAAAQSSAAQPDQAALTKWVAQLNSADLSRVMEVAYDYRALPEVTGASRALIAAALADPNGRVREHVAAALGELGGSADTRVDLLLPLLEDDDPVVLSQATLSLAKIGAPAADKLVAELMGTSHLTNPTKQALIWEDYAFAGLHLMKESAAPAIAAALVQLSERNDTIQPSAAPRPHGEYYHQLRPGLKGDELRLALFTNALDTLGPLGSRVAADKLVEASLTAPASARAKLQSLALTALSDAAAEDFVDPDPPRTQRLVDFILRQNADDLGYDAPRRGDLSIALLDRLLATGKKSQATGLLMDIEVRGPLIQTWLGMLEFYLVSSDPELRQAAAVWLARHESDMLPVSEHALFALTASQDTLEATNSATYLAHLGNRSPELLSALVSILKRPGLDSSFGEFAIEAIALFGEAARPAEEALVEASLTKGDHGAFNVRCRAIEALAAIGARSTAAVDAMLASVGQDDCLPEAISALKAIGLSADDVLARVQTKSRTGKQPDKDSILGYFGRDRDEPDERTILVPDTSQPPLSATEILVKLAATNILGQRHLPSQLFAPEMNRPYRITPVDWLDGPIDEIENSTAPDFNQFNPLFAALADLSIFKLVQDEVAVAAEERLVLANPLQEPMAGAAPPPNYVRLLPQWPWGWPPPRYSSWGVVDTGRLPASSTIGTVFDRLSRALQINGYDDNRLYGVPTGVAVVTHLEQTTPDGAVIHNDERWSYEPTALPKLSFARYLTEAFMGIRSHYRLFVFFLAKQADISGGTSSLSFGDAKDPKVDGARVLPPEIARVPWSGFYLHAVVYRFQKINGIVTPIRSDLPSNVQLEKAGIGIALQPRS